MSKDDEFDPSIPEDERRFYLKAYPDVAHVRERKVHCTICKMHIGTAPANESLIRMHPILRVTHCKKCHDFYNSGEFSKGEDGSELYCRWCGQGGEVYCCSNCPFVFCKSCIISNLSRGVVADIEQNENWSCFNCAPKMLWPLRAQHWALIKFIDKQKKAILNSTLSDAEIKQQMLKDRSLCCKIKKGSGYGTDSSDSSDISLSRLKKKAGEKRSRKSVSKEDLSGGASPAQSKKIKANDEVVCTPDVMSMLEPECTLTVPASVKVQPTNPQPSTPTPKILSIQPPAKRITPPPLQFRNAGLPALRPAAPPTQILKKTVVGQRMPVSGQGSDYTTPVYHTINGYRIDLNSAAQQETVRLPNGKLIQVKRQGTGPQQIANAQSSPNQHSTPTRVIHNISTPTNVVPIAPQQQIVHSSGGHIIRAQLQSPRPVSIQNTGIVGQYQQPSPQPTTVQPQYQQITIRQPNQQIATIRYQSNATPQVTNMIPNGGTMQILNGTPQVTSTGATNQVAALRQVPTFIKQLFPNTPLGQSRTQLQNQIFSAMEICQHLMGKLHTLTNSNAYKTAKSMTDVKELYIHLSYLLTYAIGRFKGLQDNCLADMRDLGFTNDANSLENGQLAAEKQASDAEEDEITIVEPQTDTINLDSDNEDDQPAPTNKPNGNASVQPAVRSNSNINQNQQMIRMQPEEQQMPIVTPTTTTNADDEITAEYDFSKVASLLAGMLEVELTEGGTECVQQPKKPRKKTTHKPNPTLVKQKEMQERERLENIKKNCAKLKMEVEIPLNKVEEIYKFAKPMLDELIEENLRKKEEGDVLDQEIESKKTEVIEDAEKAEPNENDISKESVQSEKETENETHDDSEEIVVVLMEEGEETDKATTEKKTEGEAEADRELETEMEPKPAEAEIDGEAEAGTEAQVEVDAEAKVTDKAAITDDGDEAKTNKIDDEKEEDSSNLTTDEANKEKAITAESKDDEEENKTADESDFPEPELFTVDDIEAVEDQEMSGDSEKTKSSELPLKSNEVEQKMDIDSDPPQSDEKVVVPNEVLTPTKEDKRDVDENNLDSSSLSHNFNALLGQTEVA